jgi:NAD(P)H dehydrogenase (quinone)
MSTDQTPRHRADRYAVFGASGAQGSAIAAALAAAGHAVRGISRAGTSAGAGVESVAADLGDRDQVYAALDGVSHVSLTIPLCYDATLVRRYAENVTAAAAERGVRGVVLNSNTRIPAEPTDTAAFETRRIAEEVVLGGAVPAVVLRPAIYLENLLAPGVVDAVKNAGVLAYPLPAATPVSWVSHADLGQAVATVLTGHEVSEDLVGQILDIGGPDLIGAELADAVGAAAGRPLTFVPLDPAVFEQGLVGFLGADAAAGVAGLYHWVGRDPETAVMSGGADGLKKLGVTPTSAADWAARQHAWAPMA